MQHASIRAASFTIATVLIACSDGYGLALPGSGGATTVTGSSGSATSGAGGAVVAASGTGNAPLAGAGTTGGSAGHDASGGSSTAGGAAPAATGGSDLAGSGGTAPGGAPSTGGADAHGPSGPFKILIVSTALEYPHASIPTCQQMLADLGKAEANPNNQWGIEVESDDLAHFTETRLKAYQMLFWCSPTGTVFSSNPKVRDGQGAMKAFQAYVEGGGAWGGVHSASDFEKTNGFPWFTNTLLGAYFDHHDMEDTPGSVQTDSTATGHPILNGLSQSYSTQEEWYFMNRDVSAVPGTQILQRLAKDNRPVTWAKEVGAGRMFYTIRGHSKAAYSESAFRTLVRNGILWSTKRL